MAALLYGTALVEDKEVGIARIVAGCTLDVCRDVEVVLCNLTLEGELFGRCNHGFVGSSLQRNLLAVADVALVVVDDGKQIIARLNIEGIYKVDVDIVAHSEVYLLFCALSHLASCLGVEQQCLHLAQVVYVAVVHDVRLNLCKLISVCVRLNGHVLGVEAEVVGIR